MVNEMLKTSVVGKIITQPADLAPIGHPLWVNAEPFILKETGASHFILVYLFDRDFR